LRRDADFVGEARAASLPRKALPFVLPDFLAQDFLVAGWQRIHGDPLLILVASIISHMTRENKRLDTRSFTASVPPMPTPPPAVN
jgi:hypothetical protein